MTPFSVQFIFAAGSAAYGSLGQEALLNVVGELFVESGEFLMTMHDSMIR
jgi:hypothetical protein